MSRAQAHSVSDHRVNHSISYFHAWGFGGDSTPSHHAAMATQQVQSTGAFEPGTYNGSLVAMT
jgi:hypothetical protein